MRVWKYDRYVSGLSRGLGLVEEAVREGVVLNREEWFDYWFKSFLSGRKYNPVRGVRELDYRCAYYFAEVFSGVFSLRREGYCFDSAISFVRRVCRDAVIRGICPCSFRVRSFDSDGVLYFELYRGRECLYTFSVRGVVELCRVVVAVATYLGSVEVSDSEYRSFLEEYLIREYNCVLASQKPEPYVYCGKSRSLRSFIRRSRSGESAEGEAKVIQLKIG